MQGFTLGLEHGEDPLHDFLECFQHAAQLFLQALDHALQVANTVIQSFVQMANASVQVRQGESQASAREGEVNATIGQSQKQKVEDQMSFDAGFMKDVLQLIQQYTQSHNLSLIHI